MKRLDKELALDALLMPVWRRKPKTRVIVHSDQVSQYGRWLETFLLGQPLRAEYESSMKLLGQCRGEVFFQQPEKSMYPQEGLQNPDMAGADVFDYIEAFYNRTCRYSHPGGVSREDYERASL
ncbi:Mobile element protein [Pseudomonas synxantha]|uniref:Mobile element protein n=1 Tax=Pseudomonas synxantha TaxID=47883 RepID=A0A3G7UC89_9PSED|nr:Mobile element protein [Pseudomonas synxantha]